MNYRSNLKNMLKSGFINKVRELRNSKADQVQIVEMESKESGISLEEIEADSKEIGLIDILKVTIKQFAETDMQTSVSTRKEHQFVTKAEYDKVEKQNESLKESTLELRQSLVLK